MKTQAMFSEEALSDVSSFTTVCLSPFNLLYDIIDMTSDVSNRPIKTPKKIYHCM